uniref:Uncharacterized protein n=1 Tax=Arundo donax TaxID=35708 RepID=A0A0A8ZZC8_ARUDO
MPDLKYTITIHVFEKMPLRFCLCENLGKIGMA